MTAQLVALVLGASDPNELARFWAHALRWDIGDTSALGVELLPTDATSFRMLVVPFPEPKDGQNAIHIDVTTSSLDDQRDTVAELLALGARHIDIGQPPEDVVLADPDGNELCVFEQNEFLAGCPRLGAVNCDGTRALGLFFSAALGWPLVWDHEDETAIQAPDGTGPKITWDVHPQMRRPSAERFHLHLAPTEGSSTEAALDELIALGARRADAARACPGATALADVDGNPLCLVAR